MGTNPVASLAALLRESSAAWQKAEGTSVARGDDAYLHHAEYLVARGVQYAPRPQPDHAKLAEHHPDSLAGRAAPPREPPLPSKPTHPTQPLVDDGKGVLHFKPNAIVRFMLDTGRNLGAFDMNKFAVMEFSDEDRRQFAQLIGYSLGGYEELSYCEDDILERVARGRPEGPSAPPEPTDKELETFALRVIRNVPFQRYDTYTEAMPATAGVMRELLKTLRGSRTPDPQEPK